MTKAKTGLDSKKSKATKSVQRSIKTPKTTKEFQAIMRQFTILARNPNMDDEVEKASKIIKDTQASYIKGHQQIYSEFNHLKPFIFATYDVSENITRMCRIVDAVTSGQTYKISSFNTIRKQILVGVKAFQVETLRTGGVRRSPEHPPTNPLKGLTIEVPAKTIEFDESEGIPSPSQEYSPVSDTRKSDKETLIMPSKIIVRKFDNSNTMKSDIETSSMPAKITVRIDPPQKCTSTTNTSHSLSPIPSKRVPTSSFHGKYRRFKTSF